MSIPLERLEGRKFCVVFVKVLDEALGKVQLQCLRGRASTNKGRVSVVNEQGFSFEVPGTAVNNILPSDGTPLLKDAEYFCLVKVDNSIQLSPQAAPYSLHLDDDACTCGHHHDGPCHH